VKPLDYKKTTFEWRDTMQTKTQTMNNEGIATLLPMSDLQEYNLKLENNTKAIDRQTISYSLIAFLFFAMIVWLIYYVMKNSVVNNIVAHCV